ncbi:MAG: hypothetical protein M3R37_06620 [Actinomycetota bacterium]|nr:hypothetical protein [Actinomycetota bacterium]
MRPDGPLLALFLLTGLIGQRLGSDLLSRGLWLTYFSTVTSVLVFATFPTASFDRPLLLAIAAGITASCSSLRASASASHAGSDEPAEVAGAGR